jgi:hypothetical protein
VELVFQTADALQYAGMGEDNKNRCQYVNKHFYSDRFKPCDFNGTARGCYSDDGCSKLLLKPIKIQFLR